MDVPVPLIERGACRTRPFCAAANKTKKLRGVERGDTRQALKTRQAVANRSRDIVRPGLRRLDCESHRLRRGEPLHPTGFAESQAPPQPPTAAVTRASSLSATLRRSRPPRRSPLVRPDIKAALAGGRPVSAASVVAIGFVVYPVRGRSGLGASIIHCSGDPACTRRPGTFSAGIRGSGIGLENVTGKSSPQPSG